MLDINKANIVNTIGSDILDYKQSSIYDFSIEGNKVIIYNYAEYKYIYKEEWIIIGNYNFENKEGRIFLEGMKEYKWYKNLGSIVNAVLKSNNNMGMFTTKEQILKAYEDTKNNNKNEVIEEVTPFETIEEIKEDTKESALTTQYNVLGIQFNNYKEAVEYCNNNDCLPELMITTNNSTIDDNKSIVESKELTLVDVNTSIELMEFMSKGLLTLEAVNIIISALKDNKIQATYKSEIVISEYNDDDYGNEIVRYRKTNTFEDKSYIELLANNFHSILIKGNEEVALKYLKSLLEPPKLQYKRKRN